MPVPPPEPEPVPATGAGPFCDCDAGSPDGSDGVAEVPDVCGGVAAGSDTPLVSIVVVPGVFTWSDGEVGSGTVTVVSVGPSCGAGPEPIVGSEPVEIVSGSPELIVCVDGVAGGSCGVVPSSVASWTLCSPRAGTAGFVSVARRRCRGGAPRRPEPAAS